jgi:signal transduction histidine kinase
VASRLFQGRESHSLDDIALAELGRRCAAAVVKRHHVAETAIDVDVPEDLRVVSDDVALETVVRNLLDNAVKYSGEHVAVRLLGRLEGSSITIEVSDEGIGIPPQHIKRVFDRFYRAPGESVRTRRGTGLGLFVVSALVRNLGGRVDAHSEGVGRGSQIRITLPRGAAVDAAVGQSPPR